MKIALPRLLAALLLAGSTGCIYVHVTGDLDEDLWEDEDGLGFHELSEALEGSVVDPEYDLDRNASPWHAETEWTVRFAAAGSDGHAAFRKAKEAVLANIEREGGTLREQHDEGPHAWSCRFELEGEPGEARVRFEENAVGDDERPHRLQVYWEESD